MDSLFFGEVQRIRLHFAPEDGLFLLVGLVFVVL